jgi:hypothetical protein
MKLLNLSIDFASSSYLSKNTDRYWSLFTHIDGLNNSNFLSKSDHKPLTVDFIFQVPSMPESSNHNFLKIAVVDFTMG